MSVPKRKTSKAKKRQCQSQAKLNQPKLSFDSKLGEFKRSHYISTNGFYKNRQVID